MTLYTPLVMRVPWLSFVRSFCVVGLLISGACDSSPKPDNHDADPDVDADVRVDGDRGHDADDGAVEPEADIEADAEADVEADAEADADQGGQQRRGGVIVISERDLNDEEGGIESSASARFFFSRHPTWCGWNLELFGDCYLFSSNTPECEPECDEEQRCEWNAGCIVASCVDPPDIEANFDAGEVMIDGAFHQDEIACFLGEEGYTCEIVADADFFEPGDLVMASAPGRAFPSFSVEVEAPPPLEVITDISSWTTELLEGGDDLEVVWNATEQGAAIEISISTAPATLSCLSADTGRFVIPAEGLEALEGAEPYSVAIIRSNAGIGNESRDGQIKFYAEVIGAIATVPTP